MSFLTEGLDTRYSCGRWCVADDWASGGHCWTYLYQRQNKLVKRNIFLNWNLSPSTNTKHLFSVPSNLRWSSCTQYNAVCIPASCWPVHVLAIMRMTDSIQRAPAQYSVRPIYNTSHPLSAVLTTVPRMLFSSGFKLFLWRQALFERNQVSRLSSSPCAVQRRGCSCSKSQTLCQG